MRMNKAREEGRRFVGETKTGSRKERMIIGGEEVVDLINFKTGET